jgi:phage-related tail protein
MMNPANVQRAKLETSEAASKTRGDTSKNPSTGTAETDPVDHAINSLRKHTAETEANTKAVGLGEAALVTFRAQAQETAAVQANGGKETADQAAQFRKLQQQAGAAADALAKAKLADQNSFSRQTAFLTPEDVAIASQLKGVYGSDVPKALASTEAAAIRTTNALKGIGEAFSGSINGPLLDFETGSKTATQSIQGFAAAFSRSLLSMANQALIVKPLLQGFGLFGATGSGSTAVMSAPGDLGAGTGGLSFPQFAKGTDSAPGGLAWVGEKGPELVNLPKGAQVIPNHVAMSIPGYADGTGSQPPLFGSPAGNISVGDIHVHGTATNGSPSQNLDLAKQIAGHVKDQVSAAIGAELRTQGRPGGMLRK